MHCSGLQRDSLVDPLFATRGQWRRRASVSEETPPIDLLLYCVRRPTVFSEFLVCQSHKPRKSNVQLCCISEQNFSERIVLLFKNSTTGMQFLLRFYRFRRLLNSATAELSSRIDAHTLAGPQRVCFPPRCCKPDIKGIPRDVKLPCPSSMLNYIIQYELRAFVMFLELVVLIGNRPTVWHQLSADR